MHLIPFILATEQFLPKQQVWTASPPAGSHQVVAFAFRAPDQVNKHRVALWLGGGANLLQPDVNAYRVEDWPAQLPSKLADLSTLRCNPVLRSPNVAYFAVPLGTTVLGARLVLNEL